MPADILRELREMGYDGDLSVPSLIIELDRHATFSEALELGKAKWALRAIRNTDSFIGYGKTYAEALADLLVKAMTK